MVGVPRFHLMSSRSVVPNRLTECGGNALATLQEVDGPLGVVAGHAMRCGSDRGPVCRQG